jgi:hypothetical protein
MSIENQENSAEKSAKISSKKKFKKSIFLIKIFLLILAIFLAIMYFQNFKIDKPSRPKFNNLNNSILNQNQENNNVLDISEDYQNNNETTLHDLNISEIKEKGAEFVYQLLIKNQVQIEDLNNQVRTLKSDFDRLKNQEKFNKLILSYIDLREKIFNHQECQKDVESFDLLVAKDEFLEKKFSIIKENYSTMPSHEDLVKNFNLIIKELIINENYSKDNADFLTKLQHNFKKIIIVRKISQPIQNSLEYRINKIENLIDSKNYSSALTELLTLDKLYFPIIEKFLEDLGLIIEINNADQDIIRYLKNLN